MGSPNEVQITSTVREGLDTVDPSKQLNGTFPTDPQVSCDRAIRYSGLGVHFSGSC